MPTASRRGTTLSDVGEIAFLRRLARLERPSRGVELGIGDDAAVVRIGSSRLLLTTDALVEGTHFHRRWDSPSGLGRRAFAVNASDLAAMGARPRFALLSIALPGSTPARELESFIRGFIAAGREVGCALVGGNLSAAERWMVAVTLTGEIEAKPLTRAGARPGDFVYVSGTLGGAGYGREILLGERHGGKAATRRFLRPEARLDLGAKLATGRLASAAIDVSDGLLQDLGHLCRASRAGAVVEVERLPVPKPLEQLAPRDRRRLALSGGEDYELCFTVPPSKVGRLERSAADLGVAVTRIGEIVRRRGVRVLTAEGRALAPHRPGFDHFR